MNREPMSFTEYLKLGGALMSIRQYRTDIIPDHPLPLSGGPAKVWVSITSPLMADPVNNDRGFITEYRIHWSNSTTPLASIRRTTRFGQVVRRTWLVKNTSRGLQRQINYSPYTEEHRRVSADGMTDELFSRPSTNKPVLYLRSEQESEFTSESPCSIDPPRFLSLLDGIVLTGAPVQPFIDYLIDEVSEFSPYFTSAGRITADEAEFKRWRAEIESINPKGASDD